MKKRDFLTLSAAAAALPAPVLAQQTATSLHGPALLTITGQIGKRNRGALDPALDQMMAKQKIQFDKAYVFDFAALAAMPKVSIKPTLDYDQKVHTLSGPLLTQVLRVAGASAKATRLLLRAVDGYAVTLSLADVNQYKFVLATHLDGQPMPLGGLGPLWALFDADRFADAVAKPLTERFAQCPWALYHIDVQAA